MCLAKEAILKEQFHCEYEWNISSEFSQKCRYSQFIVITEMGSNGE